MSLHLTVLEALGPHMIGWPPRRGESGLPALWRNRLFGERGGVFVGQGDLLLDFADLTRVPVWSPETGQLGVRYACRPHGLGHPEVAAFHTHPVRYDRDLRMIRRRIDRHLWLSDADVHAFRAQHRRYGYLWHLIGALDVGAFHIEDVLRGRRGPRLVFRCASLEQIMPALEAVLVERERLLHVPGGPTRRPTWSTVDAWLAPFLPEGLVPSRHASAPEVLALAPWLARTLRLLGLERHWASTPLAGEPGFVAEVRRCLHLGDQQGISR
ncbi:MAG: hypothetical protein VKO21_01710 [Candidatus Sericytochromatia bacterium]|nr:hypothetical protein [Candidatus Sericytochromatia bacterium]